jgi:hypothetical protein
MKNKLFTAIIILTGCFSAYTQTIISKNLITDFGAIGNGITNDALALRKAGRFFSNLDVATGLIPTTNINYATQKGNLTIPVGTYLIDGQVINNSPGPGVYYGYLEDLISIANVSGFGLEIVCSGTIVYSSNIKYGCYQNIVNPSSTVGCIPANINYGAYVGNTLLIKNSSNVNVKGLKVIGGINATNFVTNYSDVGIQGLGYNGIIIINSKNVTVTSADITKMGSDGIMIKNPNLSSVLDNITLINCIFDYNGRNGLSWVGGNGLNARQCSFSNSGKNFLQGNPGCGIDIENESSLPLLDQNSGYNPYDDKIKNGQFINCTVINNVNWGLISDGSGGGANSGLNFHNKDMLFDGCTFATTGWGQVVWDNGVNNIFNNCNINGAVVHGRDAINDYEAIKFSNCNFSDEYNNVQASTGSNRLVDYGYWGQRAKFNTCTFNIKYKSDLMHFIPDLHGDPTNTIKMTDCSFICNTPISGAGFLRNVEFIGNTTFKALNSIRPVFDIGNSYIDNKANSISKFTVDGIRIEHGQALSTLMIGQKSTNRIDLHFTNGGIFWIFDFGKTKINQKANLRFSSVLPSTNGLVTGFYGNTQGGNRVELDGNIVMEDNTDFSFVQTNVTNTNTIPILNGPTAQFNFSKGATVSTYLSPLMCMKGDAAGPNFTGLNCTKQSKLIFDGVNDYVKVDEFERLNNNAPATTFSLDVFAKPTGLSTQYLPLLARYTVNASNVPQNGFELASKGNRIVFTVYKNSIATTYSNLNIAFPSPVSSCTQFAVTYNGTTLTLYDNNGAQTYTVSGLSISPNNINAPLYIGRNGKTNSIYFKGEISHVGIWKNVLSASDLSQIKIGTYPLANVKQNAYAHYLFDDYSTDYCLTDQTIYYNESATVKYAKTRGVLGSTVNPDVNDPVFSTSAMDCSAPPPTGRVSNNLSSNESSEINTETFQIYPNPFSNMIQITSEISGDIFVYDALNKLVFRKEIEAGKNEINTNTWQKGVYILNVIQKNEIIKHFKIIKE